MKKIIAVTLILFAALILSACANETDSADRLSSDSLGFFESLDQLEAAHNAALEKPSGGLVVIKEKLFIAQTNDIYFNAEDYLGKTIKYEGIFDIYADPETGNAYYSVIRYGPGCCGVDANAGFEVMWDQDYPERNDWVEAVGVLEEFEENGFMYLRLALTSLTVLDTRGAEYVAQ